MKNLWEKFKEFVSRAWNGLTKIGKILLGLIVIATIVLFSVALVKNTNEDTHDQNKHDEDAPEIAQVYEPSIGTPLPADNSGGTIGNINGASTTESPESTNTAESTTNFIAPHSGIDPKEPVVYSNADYKFAATLPAGSLVSEHNSRIVFSSKNKSLHYIVSINKSSETLNDIELQLRNSPTASNISRTTFNGAEALKFSAQGFSTGIVFVNNDKVYYLLGDNSYFSTFKLL